MAGGLSRIILYVLFVTLPVWIVTGLGGGGEGILIDIGRNCALIGFMILMFQFLLAARIKWIERAFGLDILIRYHKHMALTAGCLLIVHPFLLAWGSGHWELLIGLRLPWPVWVGKGVLILVVINLLLSLYQGKIGLSFERWRTGHDLLAPIILVSIFIHSWFIGDDLEMVSMQILWAAVGVLAAVLFVYHRLIRPKRLKRHPYEVKEVQQETQNVWTVKLVPPTGQVMGDYLPGQFHFLTFFRNPSLPVEEHHWTISSSPAQKDFISSTIKASGDFTATMGQTRPGDTAAVHGPFGRFSYLLHPQEQDLVFLIGGIGITPVMAMLRYMRDTQDDRSVVLLYANKTQDQIVFREELDQIAKGDRPDLEVVHVLSHPKEKWTGETGYMDGDMVQKYCGNLDNKTFYICGPPKMAESLIAALRQRGVEQKRIRQEIFSFLD